MSFSKIVLCAVLAAFTTLVNAQESHEIVFTNNCGFGTPTLRAQNGAIVSTGGSVIIEGEFLGGIAYLQTGGCGNNGEGCTLIETTLLNGGSSTDISLIPPHEFSVTSGFGYFNGCDGAGADCTNENCNTAFHQPGDTQVIVGCGAPNVGLAITFCD